MRELALNILDIAQNSVRANASVVEIGVTASVADNRLTLSVKDDGTGMSEQMVKTVTDPFTTTRTTRKVGMGLPLLKMDAELCDGTFDLDSVEGKGTTVTTTYRLDHVDRPPLGDLAATVTMLINGAPHIRWILHYGTDTDGFTFDSEEVRQMLDGVAIDEPEVLSGISSLLADNINESNGGIII